MTHYEFPMLHEDAGMTNVVARLARLLDVAQKLAGAEVPMSLTTSGLAFGLEQEGVNDFLAALGIKETVSDTPGKTLDEVCEAVGRLHDELRDGRLDEDGRARLEALRWVLGWPLEGEDGSR